MSARMAHLGRRAFIGGMASAMLTPLAVSAQGHRLAAIDWAMLETALMLGQAPVAATELIQYRKIVIEPAIPPSTADLGLRGTPNLELLRTIAPSLILSSNFYEGSRANFERIAPVFSAPVYEPGRSPFDLAVQATRLLGNHLGIAKRAETAIVKVEGFIQSERAALAAHVERPVFIVSIGDARHFRAFGADSMFGDVLDRLGFDNAWSAGTSYSAAAPVGIEALARVPEAILVIIAPVPPEAHRTLGDSGLWNALPMVAAGRVVRLDPVNHFGGLPAARRFAQLFGTALRSLPND